MYVYVVVRTACTGTQRFNSVFSTSLSATKSSILSTSPSGLPEPLAGASGRATPSASQPVQGSQWRPPGSLPMPPSQPLNPRPYSPIHSSRPQQSVSPTQYRLDPMMGIPVANAPTRRRVARKSADSTSSGRTTNNNNIKALRPLNIVLLLLSRAVRHIATF